MRALPVVPVEHDAEGRTADPHLEPVGIFRAGEIVEPVTVTIVEGRAEMPLGAVRTDLPVRVVPRRDSDEDARRLRPVNLLGDRTASRPWGIAPESR